MFTTSSPISTWDFKEIILLTIFGYTCKFLFLARSYLHGDKLLLITFRVKWRFDQVQQLLVMQINGRDE